MVFVYTAMGVLCVDHANVLEFCYIELLSGDGSPYSILSDLLTTYSTGSCYQFSRRSRQGVKPEKFKRFGP